MVSIYKQCSCQSQYRTLNFLIYPICSCSSAITATAYLTIVCPIMEYAAVIWDPFHLNNTQQLEKVQCRAASWVLNDFSWYSPVSAMIDYLSWPTLDLRREISRLQTLDNIINEHYSLAIPPRFISMGRSTRLYHPSGYVLPNARTYSYQQSFYPWLIKDCNNLLSYLIECDNFDSFSWTACIAIIT